MSKFIRIAAPFIVPADIKSHGLRLVFDIEANGLLDTASKAQSIFRSVVRATTNFNLASTAGFSR